MSKPRQYELVYVAAPESSEEVLADLASQVTDIVSRFGGTLENTEDWGRRRLAYEIGGHRDGMYVLHRLHGGGDMVKELDRRLRVIDSVIRHLVIRVDEALRIADRTRDRRLSRSRRRRIARGLPPDHVPRGADGAAPPTPAPPTPAPSTPAPSTPAPSTPAPQATEPASTDVPATETTPATPAPAPDSSSTAESSASTATSTETTTQEEG